MAKEIKMKKANLFMVSDSDLDASNDEFMPVFSDSKLLRDGEVDSFIGQSPPKSPFLLPGKSASTGTKSANLKPLSVFSNEPKVSSKGPHFISPVDNVSVNQLNPISSRLSRCATSPSTLHNAVNRIPAGEATAANKTGHWLSNINKPATSEINLNAAPPKILDSSSYFQSSIGPPPMVSTIKTPRLFNPVTSTSTISPVASKVTNTIQPYTNQLDLSNPTDNYLVPNTSAPTTTAIPISMYPSGNGHESNVLESNNVNIFDHLSSQKPAVYNFQNQYTPDSGYQDNYLPNSFQRLAMSGNGMAYQPVQTHWFYSKLVNGKTLWFPFSLRDSLDLEEACQSASIDEATLIPTDGGRYDVNILERKKYPIYWHEEPMPVRRASWFYKSPLDSKYTPYEEKYAAKLEEEYKNAVMNDQWHRKIEFPGGQKVVMHGPNMIVQFASSTSVEEWTSSNVETNHTALAVKRGASEFDINDGEPVQIDHLVFVVHGCGSVCDFKFRVLNEVVDDFRHLSNEMIQTHYRSHIESSKIGRIEYLPVSWHQALHGDETGIDEQLKYITLRSIPKLRHFTNDTLLDILFYTSPVYCQHIMETVGYEINKLYHLFLMRNKDFNGKVSLVGHSLGSLILFDLLLHQSSKDHSVGILHKNLSSTSKMENLAEEKNEFKTVEDLLNHCNATEYLKNFEDEKIDLSVLLTCNEDELKTLGVPFGPRKKLVSLIQDLNSKSKGSTATPNFQEENKELPRLYNATSVNYKVGTAGTGQPFINYPKLDFGPASFFALGSPIAMFVTVRGLETLGEDFKLPTCPSVYNIFHPYDPVAYRLETLLNPKFDEFRPVLIPHHKGRKRMHLELKEAMQRVGTDLKTKFFESLKSTWNSLYKFNLFGKTGDEAHLEEEVNKCIEAEMLKHDQGNDITYETFESNYPPIGNLNGGRRIDYVLQERPIESFNEYLFAMSSHLCYWTSEDTVLMIVKEIYASSEIHPDDQNKLESPFIQTGQATPGNFTPQQPIMPQLDQSTSHSIGLYEIPDTATQPSEFTSFAPSVPSPATHPNVIGSRPVMLNSTQIGVDPTAPPSEASVVAPPPMMGFVRQKR